MAGRRALVVAVTWLTSAAPSGVRAAQPVPVDVESYRVEITPDFEGHSISGVTTMLALARGVDAVRFPVEGLTIDNVRAGDVAVPFTLFDGGLSVAVGPKARRGPIVELTIRYHGSPEKSLVWRDRSVHTTYFSCGWMICDQDRPGEKASFELEFVVPADLTVVASGTEVSVRPDAAGRVLRTWRQDRPYANYLFGFAIGLFEHVTLSTRPPGLDVVGQGASPERLAALFRDTEGMRAFFEDKAGVPLPAHYTQVLVDADMAQEASKFSLIGRQYVEPILDDPHEDWVIAHELAHQWWGNLVTCASWQRFWLNEGLTVSMVAAYKERRWGRAEYDRELERARQRRQNAIDANFDVPLAYSGAYPSPKIKRFIAYSKGALFVDELRRTLGERAFWEGIRRYTQAHAGGAVESRDFQVAMEAASGRDLSRVFATWVYGT